MKEIIPRHHTAAELEVLTFMAFPPGSLERELFGFGKIEAEDDAEDQRVEIRYLEGKVQDSKDEVTLLECELAQRDETIEQLEAEIEALQDKA